MKKECCYTLLSGEKINLEELTSAEKIFLEKIRDAYLNNENYMEFVIRIYRRGSPMYCGGSRITSEISHSILYKICEDLEFRLGIEQGFIKR